MGAGASTKVQPKYKWDHDHALRGPWTFLFKEKVQCACEGSKWCTRENPAKQKEPNAIAGLHSSWVGDWVLAMARPWQSLVEQHRLVEAFQRENIGMVLNLQELGEHASCGPGNLPHTGFTYDPESFMVGGVGYYNFSWRDMGVPSLDRMMDIVQVMDFVTRVERRKIAVHCHAGLGRTGLAIACFFIYTDMYGTAQAAIAAVRKNRPGAVQTSKQVEFVTIFGLYLDHLRCLFAPPKGSNMGGTAAGRKGKAGGSLETRSAPPGTSGGDAAGKATAATQLPQEGLLESKETGNSLVGVYRTGLTVTVPLQQEADTPAAAGSDVLTEDDLGLQQPLPWNDSFHIQPHHAREFKARPPASYTEALARQGRLLHGPQRRAFLRLHMFVKEAVFILMNAAQAFAQTSGGGRSVLTLPSPLPPIPEEESGPVPAVATSASAPLPRTASSPPEMGAEAKALLPTFAHVLALLLAHHSPAHVDSAGLETMASNPVYAAFTGAKVDTHSVLASLAQLKADLNGTNYGRLQQAPLLQVVMLLEAFFGNFASGPEPSSLTPECLKVISKSYQDLFDGQVPAPPGTPSAASLANGPTTTANGAPAGATANGAPAGATANGAPAGATANGTSTASDEGARSLEYARQAYEILEPLEPRDSELLLVFAAMMRVVARVSGPGCEAAMVDIGKWATGLLIGRRLSSVAEASEAVLSFLWYLAGQDEAFAMMVLLKRQRMAGVPRRTDRSGPVDMPAMLQAAAVALVAPPPPLPQQSLAVAATAVPVPRLGPLLIPGSAEAEAAPAPADSAAAADAEAAAAAAAAYLDANSPHMLPALQLAQLHSQDIQALYQASFREALAGITTVVYPPPMATGRIDVHDVWR